MSLAWYALWFIVAISLLVTVHEYGHYWVARRLGFKVLRFSVGFGKPLVRWVGGADKTEYVIAALPIGGYVKLLDEREGPVPPAELSRSFTRKPPWQRILVLLAGPAMNILFAIVVLWGMRWSMGITEVKPVVGTVAPVSAAAEAGLRTGDEIIAIDGTPVTSQPDVVFGLFDSMSAKGEATLSVRGEDGRTREAKLVISDPKARRRLTEPALLFDGLGFHFQLPPIPAVIANVVPDGPAARAGLQPGDQVLAIDDTEIRDFTQLQRVIEARPGEEAVVRYLRDGAEHTTRLTIGAVEVDGRTVGRIQVERPARVRYPDSMLTQTPLTPIEALTRATVEAWEMTVLQAKLVWRMLMGNVSLKMISGPISIAEFAGESANDGAASFLGFLVLISLSLGFLNLLPIPILDGGQIVFQAVEWLKGSPLSERAQAFGQQVGIALLILLMGVALFNDIARQFT
jgi:regulator of sigma E protease